MFESTGGQNGCFEIATGDDKKNLAARIPSNTFLGDRDARE